MGGYSANCRICGKGWAGPGLKDHVKDAHGLKWNEYTERYRLTATWPPLGAQRPKHLGPWTRTSFDSAMRLGDRIVDVRRRNRDLVQPLLLVLEMLRDDGTWVEMHRWTPTLQPRARRSPHPQEGRMSRQPPEKPSNRLTVRPEELLARQPLLPAVQQTFRGYEGERGPWLGGKYHSRNPPPIRSPEWNPDRVGVSMGRLTIMGVTDAVVARRGRVLVQTLWVVRCACGVYETREVRWQDEQAPACAYCRYTASLVNRGSSRKKR